MRCAAPLAELVGHRTRRGVPCRRLRTGTPMDRRRIAVCLSGAAAFVPLYAPQSLLPLLREFVGNSPAMAGAVVSAGTARSEEHTSELQSLMRISYAVFCLKKKKTNTT